MLEVTVYFIVNHIVFVLKNLNSEIQRSGKGLFPNHIFY